MTDGKPSSIEVKIDGKPLSFRLRKYIWGEIWTNSRASINKTKGGWRGCLWHKGVKYSVSGSSQELILTAKPPQTDMPRYKWVVEGGKCIIRLYDPIEFVFPSDLPEKGAVDIGGVRYDLEPDGKVKPWRNVKNSKRLG